MPFRSHVKMDEQLIINDEIAVYMERSSNGTNKLIVVDADPEKYKIKKTKRSEAKAPTMTYQSRDSYRR